MTLTPSADDGVSWTFVTSTFFFTVLIGFTLYRAASSSSTINDICVLLQSFNFGFTLLLTASSSTINVIYVPFQGFNWICIVRCCVFFCDWWHLRSSSRFWLGLRYSLLRLLLRLMTFQEHFNDIWMTFQATFQELSVRTFAIIKRLKRLKKEKGDSVHERSTDTLYLTVRCCSANTYFVAWWPTSASVAGCPAS